MFDYLSQNRKYAVFSPDDEELLGWKQFVVEKTNSGNAWEE